MDTGKIVVGGLLTTLVVGAIYGAVKVTHTANAAGKLDADIESVSTKEVKKGFLNLPTAAIYTVKFTVKNPTSDTVEISQPYIKFSIKDKTGAYKKIATTAVPSSEMLTIKGRQSTTISHDIEVKAQNVLPVVPGFVNYLLDRLAGVDTHLEGLVEFTADALGVTISDSKTMSI